MKDMAYFYVYKLYDEIVNQNWNGQMVAMQNGNSSLNKNAK